MSSSTKSSQQFSKTDRYSSVRNGGFTIKIRIAIVSNKLIISIS